MKYIIVSKEYPHLASPTLFPLSKNCYIKNHKIYHKNIKRCSSTNHAAHHSPQKKEPASLGHPAGAECRPTHSSMWTPPRLSQLGMTHSCLEALTIAKMVPWKKLDTAVRQWEGSWWLSFAKRQQFTQENAALSSMGPTSEAQSTDLV